VSVKEYKTGERDFSIELNCSKQLRKLSTSNKPDGGVLIEGTLGSLQYVSFVEPEILEVKGSCGVLRLNVWKSEVKDADKHGKGGEDK